MNRGRLMEPREAQRFDPPELRGAGPNASPEDRAAEAVRAGFAQGLAQGRAEAQAALAKDRAAAGQKLAQSLAELHTVRREILEQGQRELVELALTIASRIVRARIEAGDPVAARIAAEVLARTAALPGRKIRLNPEDHEIVLAHCPGISGPGGVELVPDPAIERGGLVVECAAEAVDARVGTALEIFREALAEEPA
ncbi:MAG: hypothetical protein KBD01_16555 [Acidobacteria bacterium]|nr:hypothetical protein [Acidobacteriota bacterium]